jgi:hypothetical protein
MEERDMAEDVVETPDFAGEFEATSRRVVLDVDVSLAIARVREALRGQPGAIKSFERVLVYLERENSAIALNAHRYQQLYEGILEHTAPIIRKANDLDNDRNMELARLRREIAAQRRQAEAATATAKIEA